MDNENKQISKVNALINEGWVLVSKDSDLLGKKYCRKHISSTGELFNYRVGTLAEESIFHQTHMSAKL